MQPAQCRLRTKPGVLANPVDLGKANVARFLRVVADQQHRQRLERGLFRVSEWRVERMTRGQATSLVATSGRCRAG